MKQPVVGSWWRSARARGQLFRFDGMTPEGAFRFTKFNEDRKTVVSEIEIFNLGDLEPADESAR